MTTGRIPPHDMTAERAALGCAMLDSSILVELAEALRPQDFYVDRHAKIFAAMLKAHAQGHATDTDGLRSQLGSQLEAAGGDEYLLGLTDTIPTADAALKHAARLQKLATVRDYIKRAHELAASGYGAGDGGDLDEWLDGAEQSLSQLPTRRGATRSKLFSEVIDTTYNKIQQQAEAGSGLVGQPTGLNKLDRHLAGMADGQLIIIAGRPGMGKSALAEGLTTTTAKLGNTAAVFSLEMMDEVWGRRHLSQQAQIDGHVLRTATGIDRDMWPRLASAAGKSVGLPIHFWDKPGTTIREIRSECRRIDREDRAAGGNGLRLVVVDYLQLVRSSGDKRSREEEVSSFSRELKELAKELRLPVVALAQLNRSVEQRPNKRPIDSDLRESGAIEQDADTILFIYRDQVYNPYKETAQPPMTDLRRVAEVIISKNREGGVGMVKVAWIKEFTQFRDLDEYHDDDNHPPEDWHDRLP